MHFGDWYVTFASVASEIFLTFAVGISAIIRTLSLIFCAGKRIAIRDVIWNERQK